MTWTRSSSFLACVPSACYSFHYIASALFSALPAPFKAVVACAGLRLLCCALLFDASVSPRLVRSLSSLVWFGYGLTPPMDLIPHLNNQVLLVLAREFPSCDADFPNQLRQKCHGSLNSTPPRPTSPLSLSLILFYSHIIELLSYS